VPRRWAGGGTGPGRRGSLEFDLLRGGAKDVAAGAIANEDRNGQTSGSGIVRSLFRRSDAFGRRERHSKKKLAFAEK
jgi:hypothetical protein